MAKTYSYFCPCPRGLEEALSEELREIAQQGTMLQIHNSVPGGVHCSGELTDGWRINLHSRIASRVLLRIAQAGYRNENDIYDLVLAQQWEQWFNVDHTIRVDLTAIKSPLRSLDFTTLKIKDGVVDRFREQIGNRPSIDTRTPDMRIFSFVCYERYKVHMRRNYPEGRMPFSPTAIFLHILAIIAAGCGNDAVIINRG